jgi:ABC-type multidrug transport system fused ATPase/permease subunit
VLPLLEPSQLPTLTEEVPVIESKQDSSPEQASSWLSWITFFYIDPFINRANRLPRIGPEDFVALPNTETVLRLVQSSFPVIDRFSGAPNRHIGVSLLILFRKEFVICAVLILVKVASNFTVPFAINRILNHLESHGEGAVFRPWVWVALLLIGPCIGTLAFQVYAYINVVSAVRAEAFLTRLIFDHALRMRAKADTGPEKDDLDGKKATQSNFAGKLNNLITLDMWNIADGREFLVLSKSFANSM